MFKGVNKTHGLSSTKLYKIWNSIMHRGGKASMCDDWKDFMTFYDDMVVEYDKMVKKHSVVIFKRRDNNSQYSLSNYLLIPSAPREYRQRGVKRNRVKMYADYIDDDVKRGNISKRDAAYYKEQNKNAVKNGHGGVFHGKLSNKK